MGNVNGSDRVLHSHGYLPWQITPSEVGLKPKKPLVSHTSVTPIFKVTLNFILNGLAKYKVSRTFIRELIL
jgi:hypothetical protein